jgi:hypothetical protein
MRNVPECPRRVVCHERAELVVTTQPNELAVSVSITSLTSGPDVSVGSFTT